MREEVEDVIILALGHRERRNILKIVHSAENGACSLLVDKSEKGK